LKGLGILEQSQITGKKTSFVSFFKKGKEECLEDYSLVSLTSVLLKAAELCSLTDVRLLQLCVARSGD